jgi:NAD(P)-dependent dehydrogenase (short-subunit alcohol dehydrogenase family)
VPGCSPDLARLFEAVKAGHGRLDVVFASAGFGQLTEPLGAVTVESFDDVFAVNVRGTLLTVRHAVPLMTAGGSVIINGSAGAVKGVPGSTIYAASKAALCSFARTWTAELGGRAIRVNLLSPGPIQTATFDGIPADVQAGIKAMIPVGRFGQPPGNRHRRAVPRLRRLQLRQRRRAVRRRRRRPGLNPDRTTLHPVPRQAGHPHGPRRPAACFSPPAF